MSQIDRTKAKKSLQSLSGVLCAVNGCRNSARMKFRMFTIPSRPKYRKAWLRAACLLNNNVKPTAKICEIHFAPEAILGKSPMLGELPKYNIPARTTADGGDVGLYMPVPAEEEDSFEKNAIVEKTLLAVQESPTETEGHHNDDSNSWCSGEGEDRHDSKYKYIIWEPIKFTD